MSEALPTTRRVSNDPPPSHPISRIAADAARERRGPSRLERSGLGLPFFYNSPTEARVGIPLYVGGETQAQTDSSAETATTALPDVLAAWLESSTEVRKSLRQFLAS